MANVPETDNFSDVYQLETTDQVLGGTGGIVNRQAEKLADRTLYLKNRLEATQKSLPIGSVGGMLVRARWSASTGIHDFITAATGGLGTNWVATVNAAAGDDSFEAVFQNGYDSNGVPLMYYGIKQANFQTPTYSTSGLHYIIAVINTITLEVTADAVVDVVVSPIVPTASGRTLHINPETGKTRLWDGASWSDIVAVVVGEITIIDTLGTLSIGTIRHYETWKAFYNPNIDAGTLLEKASATAPMGGYLFANGSVVTRTKYPRLFNEIGTTYNTGGEAGTTFRLPDYRAMFLRGIDASRGIDTARALSPSYQEDEFEEHLHEISGDTVTGVTGGHPLLTADPTGPYETTAVGGDETRPKNMAVYIYIKY